MKSFDSQEDYNQFCIANLARLEQALQQSQPGPLINPVDYGLSNQDDSDLLQRYTRHHQGEFQVLARIEWDGHRPQACWEPCSLEPAQVLQDSRYFVSCFWCGRRTHRGHLAANGVCSGCQEYFFGVRY